MTPEEKLQGLFAAAAPPARDYAFEAEVARRIALRRAWLTQAALLPWTAAGAVLIWVLFRMTGPLVETAAAALQPTAMVLTLAGSGAALLIWLARRFSTV